MSKVSVIITTKNEEKNIENCLISIKHQTYSDIEIIVVDNFSTDKTKEISLRYTDKFYEKWPERSAQRNYGMIDKSDWEYVMFVDADMMLLPDLVEQCVDFIDKNNYDALYISEIVLWKKYWSKVRRFERTFYDWTVVDWARFFRKKSFVDVWWFDLNMSWPEDWDIDKKLRKWGKVWLLKVDSKSDYSDWILQSFVSQRWVNPNNYVAVVFHNESEFDLKNYLTKKWYYAKSFDNYINKWWKDDEDIRKQLWMCYRFFGVFFENWKWLKLLKNPCLTFGMYFLRFMVGLKFIFRWKQ